MKVLFVSSGNSQDFTIAPFIKAQGESLIQIGIQVEFFLINSKGIVGYIKSACELRNYLKKRPFDLIHAHYTLSGLTAVLTFCKLPIVLSLMGSDAYGEYIGENKIKFSSRYLTLLTYLIQPLVKLIICKSKFLQSYIYLKKKSHIIPNGVLMRKTIGNKGYRKELGLSFSKKYILFLGNIQNRRKNFKVIEQANKLINSNDVHLLSPFPIVNDKVVKYLSSVDVLVVPSFMEGSANIIKEAMTYNCPVVATDVGDVRWLFGNEPGYFITSFKPEDVANKIKLALTFSEKYRRTNGRKRISNLGLDSITVANKIADLYNNVIQQ